MAALETQGVQQNSSKLLASGSVTDSKNGNSPFLEKLPEKKTFIATLSGGAFVVGVAGATVYGLRKARIQALKEAQELAATGSASTSAAAAPIASTSALPSSSAAPSVLRRKKIQQPSPAPIDGVDEAPKQGVLSLFKQMNTSILSPRQSAQAAVPTGNTPRSVFDNNDSSNTELPSVLRKQRLVGAHSVSPSPSSAPIIASSSTSDSPSKTNGPLASSDISAIDGSAIDYSEMDSTLDFLGLSTSVPKEEQVRMQQFESENHSAPTTFGQSAVGLSLKAFLIATGIVTFGAVAVVETTKRVLGVDSMDDFVIAMSRIVPGRRDVEQRLGDAAPLLKAKREADGQESYVSVRPKSMDEALEDLGSAVSVQDWMNKLKQQLDAERDEEVRRRFANLSVASNDSVSPSSVAYPIYSVNETLPSHIDKGSPQARFIRIPLGISPLLPLSAFGVGMVSGFMSAGKRAGVVFMAENAHRLPETVQGWYFYSKTKNYRVMLGAAQGGLKQGARLGLWVTAFCVAERSAELSRKAFLREFSSDSEKAAKVVGHWADGALAGVGTAGVAALLYRLPRPATIRVFQLGIAAGGLTGAIRDTQEHLLHKQIGGVARHT